jgi:hypothetical protein
MGTQVIPLGNLGGKEAGQLIRSTDWNSLVAAVAGLQSNLASLSSSVTQQFATVNQALQTLTNNVSAANARITRLETIFKDYYRITLAASQTVYAIGELAVIGVQVTDLEGKPLTFALQDRPWLTFLTTWGRIDADAGFEALGGFGDRSVSVRANAQGVCRVRLHPDHVEGFTKEAQNEVSKSLTATVQGSNRSFAELVRTTETPVAMHSTGGFKTMSAEYERSDAINVRQYVDTYFQKSPEKIIGTVVPRPQTWRDYRASVSCFATVGSDPHAGDFTRGTGSIAVDFRDWISPWYILDYSVDVAPLVLQYRDRLAPKFTKDLNESVQLLKLEVNAITAGGGLLKQRRDYDVINQALDQVTISQPPAFQNAVTQAVQNAIQVQQTLGAVSTATQAKPAIAFEAFTQTATRGDASAAAVSDALSSMQKQVTQVQQTFTDINKQVATLQGAVGIHGARLDSALAEGGIIHNLQSDVSAVKGQVGTLQVLSLNPTEIKTKLDLVTSLENRVGTLEIRR